MRLAILLALAFLSLPAAAQIYKWTDAQGRTHFSNVAPPQGVKATVVDPNAKEGAPVPETGECYTIRCQGERMEERQRRREEAEARETAARKEAAVGQPRGLEFSRYISIQRGMSAGELLTIAGEPDFMSDEGVAYAAPATVQTGRRYRGAARADLSLRTWTYLPTSADPFTTTITLVGGRVSLMIGLLATAVEIPQSKSVRFIGTAGYRTIGAGSDTQAMSRMVHDLPRCVVLDLASGGVGSSPGDLGSGSSVSTGVYFGQVPAAPNTPIPGSSLADPFVTGLRPYPNSLVGSGISAIWPEWPTPTNQMWNASIQRSFGTNLLLEAAYIGSRGMRIWNNYNRDATFPQYLSMGTHQLTQARIEQRLLVEGLLGDQVINAGGLTQDETLLGGQRIVLGLFKKFVVADTLALIALNDTLVTQVRTAGWMWIIVYAYTFQIYFDFSGYTDIAIGIARLVGVKLPENFAAPYTKPNLTQFWNSWHMTLTQWFRSYFFNPFNRWIRGYKSLPAWVMIFVGQLATMLLIGLWHGITLNFILWGAWHGFGLFLQNRWSDFAKTRVMANSPRMQTALQVGGIILTFHFVALGWVFFALSQPALTLQVFMKLLGI